MSLQISENLDLDGHWRSHLGGLKELHEVQIPAGYFSCLGALLLEMLFNQLSVATGHA